MSQKNNSIIKLCSFYVSDWHLVTMLLPYINKQIDERSKIATVLENNIQNNVETLVKKLNIKNEEKILNIDWKNKATTKFTNISKIIENNIGENIIIIINGNKEYIKKANKIIDKCIEINLEKIIETNTTIKVIDCYEIIEFNGSIIEILDNHSKILNTSGEKEINEVFEEYEKKKQNNEEENANKKIS